MADNVPHNVVTELAPNGKLRAAINFGNIVLAQKDPASGEPRGVSAELAREVAKRLGVPIVITLRERFQIVVSPRILLVTVPGVKEFGPNLALQFRAWLGQCDR